MTDLTTFMYPVSRNSESLKLLQPSWSVEACIGIAFKQVLCYKHLLKLFHIFQKFTTMHGLVSGASFTSS